MSKILWLRAETKKNEFRRALTPDSCQKIIKSGHKIYVEDWIDSIIPTSEYEKVGCIRVEANSWHKNAPDDAIIIGLKALPENIDTFRHTHVYFAHAYKEQDGWKELLSKFTKGGGKIIDLEFMLDENNRRVAAFGYWAGYVGAALGALFTNASDENKAISELNKQQHFTDKSELIEFVKKHTSNKAGNAIVIGSKGRSGSGAIDLLSSIDWSHSGWDQQETQKGGPFKEILDYDLFVNCVLAMKKMPPFITKELIETKNNSLKVISDVSCDPDSDCNMIPLYKEATILSKPLITVTQGNKPVKITAIDNLPSILPKESSYDFSAQLESYFVKYDENIGPVKVALDLFYTTANKL